jgi:molybdate transport system substrate-binding protein
MQMLQVIKMRIHIFLRRWNQLLLISLMACGCNRGAKSPNAGKAVTVFVAASTKDAVQEIAAAFKSDKNVEVKINADDSAKLATQITQDAPAHLFLSANEKWADFVKEKGFAQETALLLGNTLVIVTPKDNVAKILGADDLAKPSTIPGPTA